MLLTARRAVSRSTEGGLGGRYRVRVFVLSALKGACVHPLLIRWGHLR